MFSALQIHIWGDRSFVSLAFGGENTMYGQDMSVSSEVDVDVADVSPADLTSLQGNKCHMSLSLKLWVNHAVT